jgi:hypothetical protein
MFNQEVIVESLGTHLSALEKILAWTLLVAIPVAWAGIRREEVIKAGFLEIQRKYAFYAVATLFLVVNVALLLLFLRVAGLLALLEGGEELKKGLSKVAQHPWPFNPFSYYGGGAVARVQGCAGLGLLVVAWWIAFSALATLREAVSDREFVAWAVVFLGAGGASLGAVCRCYFVMLDRLAAVSADAHAAVFATIAERCVASVLGIAAGLFLFLMTLRLLRAMPRAAPASGQKIEASERNVKV